MALPFGALAAAGISAVGGWLSNRSNAKQARENRQFQERMSSTAAQRSVGDYQAAGLNPALAYDRPASSPGGSQAQMDDPIQKGVSSGMAARQMLAGLELTKAQTSKTKAEADKAKAEAEVMTVVPLVNGEGPPSYFDEQMARRVAAMRDMRFQGELQPWQLNQIRAQVAQSKAGTRLTKAGIPGAEAEADMWRRLDRAGPVVKALAPLLRLIRPR